jgi:hypothetical protein
MKRIHALIIAAVLAAAGVAGLTAALRTTQLGESASHSTVSAAQIAKRNRRLDKIETTLLAEVRRARKAPPTRQAAPVLYVRPKPIVHVVHRSGGEHEGEREAEGGRDD